MNKGGAAVVVIAAVVVVVEATIEYDDEGSI